MRPYCSFICVSRTYDLNYVYTYRAIGRVFSPFSFADNVSMCKPSRHTSLDTDSL